MAILEVCVAVVAMLFGHILGVTHPQKHFCSPMCNEAHRNLLQYDQWSIRNVFLMFVASVPNHP